LVEILTVIAIIGLLAAIAIPQFTAYRREAVDAEIKSDLRNAAMAMESYYAVNLAYPSSVAEIIAVGFQSTQGVTLSVSNVTIHSYLLTATKPGGSQASFIFDSTTGAIH
jgi:type IV pilus assembly protein PilA